MAAVHGSKTVIKIGTDDISIFCTNSEIEQSGDASDITTYRPAGKNSKVYGPGLLDAKLTIEGKYDSTTGTGPRAVLQPLVGAVTTWTRQPEGTGAALPQDTGSGIVTSYKETNPVTDYIGWSAEIQCSDDIDSTPQAA